MRENDIQSVVKLLRVCRAGMFHFDRLQGFKFFITISQLQREKQRKELRQYVQINGFVGVFECGIQHPYKYLEFFHASCLLSDRFNASISEFVFPRVPCELIFDPYHQQVFIDVDNSGIFMLRIQIRKRSKNRIYFMIERGNYFSHVVRHSRNAY